MTQKLRLFYQCIARFGLIKGALLFIRLSTDNTRKLKLAGLRGVIRLRPGSYDRFIFQQVFLEQQFGLHFLEEPKVIVDAGAHIGLFSSYMKSQFQDAQIVCIEPDEENFQLLKSNLAAYDNVSCIPKALWHETTQLSISDKFGIGKMAMVTEESGNGLPVKTITIDQLMEAQGFEYIDVLKIDIEGSERFVFDKSCEKWLPKVRLIIIELHDWLEGGCSQTFFEAINEHIENYEYRIKGEHTIIINKNLGNSQQIKSTMTLSE